MLELAAVLSLATACAPTVAPQTLAAIAHVESRFDPLAIGVNRGGRRPDRARNEAEAVRVAQQLLAGGANLDLGLAQINSDNLEWLGLSVEEAFDPCRNLEAAATVLRTGYRLHQDTPSGRQSALRTALSRYNTGDAWRGFRNGYVARVERAAITLNLARTAPLQVDASSPPPLPLAPEPLTAPADWDVFARSREVVVFNTRTAGRS